MNIRLVGAAPEFAGFRFRVEGGRIRVDSADAVPAGLASAIVAALGAVPGGGAASAGSVVAPVERRITVDQTNTSVIVGERLIVKLMRGWEGSERSAQIEGALAAAGSRDVPEYLGAIFWDHPELGSTTLALASEYIAGAEDGWTWAADEALEHAEREPEWPASIGALTARVHADLAQAPLPAGPFRRFDPEEGRGILSQLAAKMTQRGDATAHRVLARRGALAAALDSAPAEWRQEPALTHGDLHVGQVIREPGGRYLLLDFDGDPQLGQSDAPSPRSLGGAAAGLGRDTRERDLAHMLVSIDLVAVVAQKRAGRNDAGMWAWADRARSAFIGAYLDELERLAAPWSIDARALPALCAEQFLFELRYAEKFLPEWEYAPDGAISHRYPAERGKEDPAWTPPDS